MTGDIVALLGFAALFGLIALRVPVGVAMGLVGIFGFAAIRGITPAMNLVAISPVRVIADYNLSVIPLFILMGIFAANSGLSRELFRMGNAWLGPFKGGLALSTIASCAGFSAISGSSIATAATMSKVAMPEMRRFGYADSTATGVIAAGGTLGILIPPSVVLVVYAYITETDVAQLFMAGIIPGLLTVVLYMLTVRIFHRKGLPEGRPFDRSEAIASLSGVWPTMLLFVIVIGSIYLGVVTPTEAAALGAFATMMIGIVRGRLNGRIIMQSLVEALRVSVTIYTILIGAILFGYFLTITQSPQRITAFLVGLELGPYGTLLLILAVFIIAGCILDSMAMILLMVPIVFPVVINLGFDPNWFGILIVVAAELGMITPPIGMSVFVIKSIVRDVRITTVFKGVMPFIFTDLFRLLLLILFPALVMFLPGTM
ncbi:MAG: TRAP transporter large permease [Rhodobacteraceae bacterium]|nr:MAG: TRAP transporter large permease [Paracoccaceae bacterium]